MVVYDDTALSEDSLSLHEVLKPLTDTDCRTILRKMSESVSANELVATCDIPRSTVYRKLKLLERASLVRKRNTISPGGGRISRYERNFSTITISANGDDGISVTVRRIPRENEQSSDSR